jgi:hypothetical protein
VTADIRQLATWQVEVYWLHDLKRFDELAISAANIFVALGSPYDASMMAGRCISRAYELADQAEMAFRLGHLSDERDRYQNATQRLQEASSVLGLSPGVAAAQVAWWHRYRHKRKLAALMYISLQHLYNMRPGSVVLLPFIVAATVRIGRAHDRRERAGAVAAAERYWSLLLRAYGGRSVPYLG